jgi:hypothetical protein
MAFLYLMQAHAHCIDPIDAVTSSTFDNNRTSLRKAAHRKSRIPICLTVCLSLHQRPVRVVQLRKNQAKSKTLEPSSTSLKYDPRPRHVSPALINGQVHVPARLFGGETCHPFKLRNCTSYSCRAIEWFPRPLDALRSYACDCLHSTH